MSNFPKYQINNSSNNQFYWVLRSVNGQVLLTSETYVAKQSCAAGIYSSKTNLADSNFKRGTASNGQYFFNQVASNGQVLGTSELYTTYANCENGIAAVKRDAPVAEIEDTTVYRSV